MKISIRRITNFEGHRDTKLSFMRQGNDYKNHWTHMCITTTNLMRSEPETQQ